MLYKDENTGGADVVLDPENPDNVYAVLWESRQGPWENGVFTGPNSGVFKSADGGSTWRPIVDGLPTFAEDGLGRIGITVAPSMPQRLFATVEARRRNGALSIGRRRRALDTDRRRTSASRPGLRFRRSAKSIRRTLTSSSPRSIVAWKSTDGGRTFSAFRGAPGGDDYHRVWIIRTTRT